MEHENLDENAKYLAACENVKKIVNAIKSIKIKYYPNFAKISEADKIRCVWKATRKWTNTKSEE